MKIPLLIISDAPSASSGLGRICKDLALGIHHSMSDLYEVATLGYGGPGDRRLPFPQYPIEGMNDWFIPTLKEVWENFAGTRKGVVLTIWDASRVLWLARPDSAIFSPEKTTREWLMSKPFEKWIYAPMDAEGPKNQLCCAIEDCLLGFDRIIAYSEWAKKNIENTFSDVDCQMRELVAIPHGIHTNVFHPHQEKNKRAVFRTELQYQGSVFEDYEKIIGIVATNQTRKDYGLAMEALAEVAKEIPIRVFIQTDIIERHWSLAKLLQDFNIIHKAIVSTAKVSDEVMAKLYSACDLTLGIGPEGFGFPIFESLACGTPVIAGSVGGHAEHLPSDTMVRPECFRIEGSYNSVRPVFDPKKWAYMIKKALNRKDESPARFQLQKSLLPPRLDWKNLWPGEWEPYFRRQHQRLQSWVPAPALPNNSLEKDTAPADHRTSTIAYPAVPSGEK